MRRRYLQHQSALLPQLGNLLPRGLGILLPLSVWAVKTSTYLTGTLALTVTLEVLLANCF